MLNKWPLKQRIIFRTKLIGLKDTSKEGHKIPKILFSKKRTRLKINSAKPNNSLKAELKR